MVKDTHRLCKAHQQPDATRCGRFIFKVDGIPIPVQRARASASITVEKLQTLFATHGIPETIVSDNGMPFVNDLMRQFLKANAVRHLTVTPYHPATNGLAK